MKTVVITLTFVLFLSLASIVYAAEWNTITTFTGAASQTTNYFNVPTNEWCITWSITPTPGAESLTVFGAFVYPKGEDTHYVDYIMKFAGSNQNSGTLYVHEGTKDYYLKITTANIQNYNLKIEYDTEATGIISLGDSGYLLTVLSITIVSIAIVIAAILVILIFRRQKSLQQQQSTKKREKTSELAGFFQNQI